MHFLMLPRACASGLQLWIQLALFIGTLQTQLDTFMRGQRQALPGIFRSHAASCTSSLQLWMHVPFPGFSSPCVGSQARSTPFLPACPKVYLVTFSWLFLMFETIWKVTRSAPSRFLEFMAALAFHASMAAGLRSMAREKMVKCSYCFVLFEAGTSSASFTCPF